MSTLGEIAADPNQTFFQFSDTEVIATGILLPIMMISSVLNFLVIYIMWKEEATVGGRLVINLSFTCFVLSTQQVVFGIINLATRSWGSGTFCCFCCCLSKHNFADSDNPLLRNWRAGVIGCVVYGLLINFMEAIAIATLCVIALERYLCVIKHIYLSANFIAQVIAQIWVGCLIMIMYSLYFNNGTGYLISGGKERR